VKISPSGLAEIRKKIAESITQKLQKLLIPERKSVEQALALLAGDQMIHAESMRTIRAFYERGEEQREAFFTILASLEPRKVEYILNQIHAAMDTPQWLIALRADLHELLKTLAADARLKEQTAPLKELASVFRNNFMRVFNFQYLVTRCCNAQNTSIALLKFISEKEGVHPTEHWWNFENRLNSPDHIIISLEHFKMPYVPLVYVEVALSRGIIRKIARILGEKRRVRDVADADTAVFYSLNTTLAGLGGIGLGAKMIARAREYLQAAYPQLRHFATLSPIPGFRKYLGAVLAGGEHSLSLTRQKIDINKKGRFITPAALSELRAELAKREKAAGTLPIAELFAHALADEAWWENPALRRLMEFPMTELTRYYLTREKRANRKTGARTTEAYDQVANFHLSNGASIGSINYLANTSAKGMKESYGMMVNYVYEADRQEKNKLLYSVGKVVSMA
jgi:malonyl-CoA decarboxylase